MAGEKTPGEELVDLYVDIARIRCETIEPVPDPMTVLGDNVRQYGLERSRIGELSEADLAAVGRQGLQAYFSTEEYLQAKAELKQRGEAAVQALRLFLENYVKADIRVRQVVDTDVPMISTPSDKCVSSARGSLSSESWFYPYNLLWFNRRSWLGSHDVAASSAEVTRRNSLTPRVAVEFL